MSMQDDFGELHAEKLRLLLCSDDPSHRARISVRVGHYHSPRTIRECSPAALHRPVQSILGPLDDSTGQFRSGYNHSLAPLSVP